MRLLHWSTLQPQGSSSLAAIRFSTPVIIRVLRIFGPREPLFGNDLSILRQAAIITRFILQFLMKVIVKQSIRNLMKNWLLQCDSCSPLLLWRDKT
jgi:hypothetical protein